MEPGKFFGCCLVVNLLCLDSEVLSGGVVTSSRSTAEVANAGTSKCKDCKESVEKVCLI